MKLPVKPRVAVIYHFFAHYRSAIMGALLDCKEIDYVLVGDRSDPDNSIKPWHPPEDKLLVAPCTKVTSTLLWQKGLVRLALRRDIDVMIFLGNVNFLSTWVAALIARLTRKRVLFWTHGWIRNEQGVKALIRNLFYRLSHGLLLYGNRAKMIGVQNGFTGDTLYVIYNSLDYEAQRIARAEITDNHTKQVRGMIFPHSRNPILICTSRLIRLRGLELVLRAMSELQKQGFETSLLLVGDGPEREYLGQMARDLRLAVHFYGPCYDEDRLAELIMSANLTVAPGKVGLTAMHSLVYGTPVVTHNDPAEQMPEWEAIVPGRTGDFFKRGDVHDLAKTIHRWCARPWPDEGVRKQCMEVIDRFYNPQFQRQAINRAVAGLSAE
jgi:glycosyltransferase involved in cell wall biosynthesis